MIENLTLDELKESILLLNKGWTACDKDERKRWAQLYAKGRLYQCKTEVLDMIEFQKVINLVLNEQKS